MSKTIFFFVFLLISMAAWSQSFIDLPRGKVKKRLETYLAKDSLHGQFQETDSTIVLLLRDPKFQKADFTYQFNRKGKCIAEIRFVCDSCVTHYLNEIFSNDKLSWVQLNPQQYISAYSRHLSLEILKEGYIVKKTSWTKDRYQQIVKSGSF